MFKYQTWYRDKRVPTCDLIRSGEQCIHLYAKNKNEKVLLLQRYLLCFLWRKERGKRIFYWVMSDQAKLNQREQEKRKEPCLCISLYICICIFVFLHQYCVFVQLYLCIVFPLGHARSNPIESKGRRGNREPCFQVASFHRNQTLIGHQWVCKVFNTQNNII